MYKLTTPITIKNLKLKNRLVMPPMATAKSDDGKVSQELIDYYVEKSDGGYIGLIIVEHSYISLEGKASLGQLSMSSDADLEGLKKLVNAIHANGTKIFAQISHAGEATETEITGRRVLSPRVRSGKADSNNQPETMQAEDIEKVIVDFANAAKRAKLAGFDGVEIHSAHGYLLNQFYSPLINNRQDAYNGNTIEGRIKLHLEVIRAVREVVGKDYTIALRLGASDYEDGGTSLDDSVVAAKAFENAGVNLLDITGGMCGYINPHNKEQGHFSELSEKIKDKVSIPVLVTGGIKDVAVANELITTDKTDLVGVGRAILKDSLWAKRAIESFD